MHLRILIAVVLAIALLAAVPAAAQLSSCDAIRSYWGGSPPNDPYTLIRDMKSAIEYLATDPSGCPIYDVERVRWTYATNLDLFSRTFSSSPAATKKWATEASNQYHNYIEWFLSLSADDIDDLVVANKHKNKSTPGFDQLRLNWIRGRVGGVLSSLGGTYELTKSYGDLVDSYARFSEECFERDAGTACIRVFSAEVVERWHKWLRAMPDFAAQRSDSQIKNLLRNDDDYAREWAAFGTFLDSYVPANPSIKAQWEPLRKKVNAWLAT